MLSRPCFNGIVLLAALALLGGCTNRTISDEPIMLDIAGPVAVDVESFNGDVNIYVDHELDHATVHVVRAGDYGQGRQEEAVESLAHIHYTAELEPGDLGPTLVVRSWTDGHEPHYQRAHITINLPAAENITVRTTRGRVYATDVQGTIDIETTGGDVRVMSNWPMRDAVTIMNTEGDIDYRVGADSTGAFDAETVDGEVRQRTNVGVFRVAQQTGHSLLGTLNGGGNPITLRSVEGDIRISVVENPTEVGMWIIDP